MKIKKLTIYGYGKFENTEITLSSHPIHVFFGRNEAGKSTIMSFIHSILFGFPLKQQSEKRYEPKQGGKYGGAITIETDEGNQYMIERMAKKASGECFIYNEKGERLQTHVLDDLLKGIDKTTYQSIFSFDLNSLQRIYELNRDDLGKYLFLTSMFGSDAFYTLQQKMEKSKEQLFKPNGRKPLLNTLLQEVKEKKEELVKAKRYEEEYERLKEEKVSLNQQLNDFHDEKIRLQTSLKQTEKLHAALPLIEQKKECQNKLNEFEDLSRFTEKNRVHLERLVEQAKIHERTLNQLEEQIKQCEKALKNIPVDDIAKDYERFFIHKENYSLIRQYEEDVAKLTLEIEHVKEKLAGDLHFLFGAEKEEMLASIDTSMIVKEQVKDVVKRHEQMMAKKEWLDDQFERVKEALEEAESQLARFRSLVLERNEREKLEKERERLNEKIEKASRIHYYQEEYLRINEELKQREQSRKQMKRRFTYVLVCSISLSVFISFVLFVAGFSNVALFALLINILPLLFRPMKDPLLLQLKKRCNELKELLHVDEQNEWSFWQKELKQLDEKLLRDDQLKQKVELEEVNVKQKEEAYDRIVSQFEWWEKDYHTLMAQLKPIYEALYVPESLSAELLQERYEMIVECQQRVRERNQLVQQKMFLQKKIDLFYQDAQTLYEKYDVRETKFEVAMAELEKRLEKANELKQTVGQKEHVLSTYQPIQREIEHIVKEAGVETVEQFLNRADLAIEQREYMKRLQWIDDQLKVKGLDISDELSLKVDQNNLALEETKLEASLKELEEKEDAIRKRLAEINVRLKSMEESGVYSELKYEHEMKKSKAHEVARRWAVYAVAEDLLKKTVDYHRKHRLPALLQKVGEYFCFLTDSRYEHVLLPNERETLLVKRNDGILFQVDELSQGTAEQLYVAIRLALACDMSNRVHLPIIIDDSFVNFDSKRFFRTVELIRSISKHIQVILFTCHEHIAKEFEEQEVYDLSTFEQFETKRGF